MRKTIWIMLSSVTLLMNASVASTPIIPTDGSLYYKIGGGRNISQPAVLDTQTVRLDASANYGLGYQCGIFNPRVAIKDSLNDIKESFSGIERSIVRNATSAIAQLPMYFLARANPTLYNIFNNNIIEAHNQLRVSTKSCETMRQDIERGANPYGQWAKISAGESWKKEISLATQTGMGNVNQAARHVAQSAGAEGITWIDGQHAGGVDQPPIRVLSDTVTAAYNILLNRRLSDLSSASQNAPSNHLVIQWSNPTIAAQWVSTVVGESIIKTCQSRRCKKSAMAGRGLLPFIEKLTQSTQEKMKKIVRGETNLNRKNLLAISAPGVAMNVEVIKAIQAMGEIQKTIIINRLAIDVSTQKIIDKALLAHHLLIVGSHIPEVANNIAAAEEIKTAIAQIEKEIQQSTFDTKVRREMASSTLLHILEDDKENVERPRQIDLSTNLKMEMGAVMKEVKS